MYSIDIIKSSINLYFKLKKDNIIGKKRINYIKQTFNVHINTLYNWITTYYNVDNNTFNFDGYKTKTKFKYNNKKLIMILRLLLLTLLIQIIILI
jgi:hypothetical protein